MVCPQVDWNWYVTEDNIVFSFVAVILHYKWEFI